MRNRITCYDFGRISKLGKKKYVIEIKKHWWCEMTDKNKTIIMSMPNFDKDVFFQITGIKL